MNENFNMTTSQGEDLSNFNKSFSEYQKNQGKNTRKSKGEILKKYFVPRNAKETFRILPYRTEKFHTDAFFHVVTTTIAGGKKKNGTIIYCPAHNDPKVQKKDQNGELVFDSLGKPVMIPAPCPLCAEHKKILAKQDPSIKFIKKENMTPDQLIINEKNKAIFLEANKWEAKKFYIVKGIDKGAEKDGVKFWRFKHNFKNQGTLDKLYPVLSSFLTQNGVSFADPQFGTDLDIMMVDSTMPNGRAYKAIVSIVPKGKSPLHTDPILVKEWLEDKTTWRDVFKPKIAPGITPYEFLKLVVEGNNPYWEDTDAANKHWVFPGHPDLELAANTRKLNLDGNDGDENYEYASDLEENSNTTVPAANVVSEPAANTPAANTPAANTPAANMTAQPSTPTSSGLPTANQPESEPDDYDVDTDDLPF